MYMYVCLMRQLVFVCHVLYIILQCILFVCVCCKALCSNFFFMLVDFGLAKDLYSSDYYQVEGQRKLPVRWMAPEALLQGKFTVESDIWLVLHSNQSH